MSSKLSKIFLSRRNICGVSLFGCVEISDVDVLAIRPNSSGIWTASRSTEEANSAWQTRTFSASECAILGVFGCSGLPEIANTIIISDPIYMIDEQRWHLPINIKPSEMGRPVDHPSDLYAHVPLYSSAEPVTAFYARRPVDTCGEDASLMIVINDHTEIFCSDHDEKVSELLHGSKL